MNNNAWFKKENPFQTVIGLGGGATGFGVLSLYEFFKSVSTGLPEN